MVDYIHLRSLSSKRRACLCREFFLQIYYVAFPNPDQTEGPERWLPLMGDTVPDGQPMVHIVIAQEAEFMVGGIVLEFLPESGCWFITYIAVRPELRRHGIAAGLMRHAVNFIGNLCVDSILFAETENPACIADPLQRSFAQQRLAALDSFGLRSLPLAYVQPALTLDKPVLHNLLLLCYAPDDQPPYEQIAANRVMTFLTEYYTGLKQADSIHLQRMCTALSEVGVLQVQRLI
jgi:GNAT superfamily N-acetyltransferase